MWKLLLPILLCLTSLLQAQPPVEPILWLPADAVARAVQDLRTIAPKLREHVRYLDVGHIPLKGRLELIQTVSGHVNSLSSEPDIVPPFAVPGTQGSLLRLNFLDYGWKKIIWERLADADPYYQITLTGHDEVTWGGGTWTDGNHYEDAFSWKRAKRVLAPWLSEGINGQAMLEELVHHTGSRVPIVRGDWFLWQTVIQQGRVPGYADFLGIGNQAQWEKLIRFDAKLAAKLEQRRVVAFTGIALQPRRVERTHTVLGGLHRTFDVELAQGAKNPLRVLDNEFKFDATRQFAPLPNGMPAWWLANNKGVRQNKAPDDVVGGDRFGGGNDTRLHLNLSCLRCHMQGKGEDGVKAIDAVPIKRVSAVEYDKLVELRRQYLRDLDPFIAQDRLGYAAAIKTATLGMTSQQWATDMQKWYSFRDDAKVDLAWAARDMGMPAGRVNLFWKAVDMRGQLDPILGLLLNGGAVPIRQWEEVFPLAMVAARGYVLPANSVKIGGR